MTPLFSCAKKLALQPPIALYKRLMKLITDEQIAKLDQTQESYLVEKRKIEATAVQYDRNVDKYGQPVADLSVTSICDFVAMCMMMSAAGVERIEALKASLLDQKASCSFMTKFKDRAYLFLREDGAFEFQDLMDKWLVRKGHSIVQVKFPANSDVHTFAIEKFPREQGPYFHVYQGYQNLYSLAHFLRLKSVWNDDALKTFHEKVIWANDPAKISYKNNYKLYWDKVLRRQLDNIDATASVLGGAALDQELVDIGVAQSLGIMLDEALDNERYVALTASNTTSAKIEAPYMMVLMCDDLDPNMAQANLEGLYKSPQNVTKYLDCGL